MKKALVLIISLLVVAGCDSKKKDAEPKADTETQTARQEVKEEPKNVLIGSDIATLGKSDIESLATGKDNDKFKAYVLHQALVRGVPPRGESNPVGPLKVDAGEGKTRDINKGVLVGVGRMRGVLLTLSENVTPMPEACDNECKNAQLNTIFSAVLGKPVYGADGVTNPEGVQALVEFFKLGDAKVLGLDEATLYQVFRPTILEYAQIKAAINKVGKEDLLNQYKEALKENPAPESGPNTELMKFYQRFPNMNGIPAEAGLQPGQRVWVATGFWMRRMNDGTADMLEKELFRLVEAQDKEAFKALSK